MTIKDAEVLPYDPSGVESDDEVEAFLRAEWEKFVNREGGKEFSKTTRRSLDSQNSLFISVGFRVDNT